MYSANASWHHLKFRLCKTSVHVGTITMSNPLRVAALAAVLMGISAHCPNFCNGRGRCVGPNACECFDAWEGGDCSIRKCCVETLMGNFRTQPMYQANAPSERPGQMLPEVLMTPMCRLSAAIAAPVTTAPACAAACRGTKDWRATAVSDSTRDHCNTYAHSFFAQ